MSRLQRWRTMKSIGVVRHNATTITLSTRRKWAVIRKVATIYSVILIIMRSPACYQGHSTANGGGCMKGAFSPGVVVAVSLSAVHEFSKPVQQSIRLLAGLGVEGDTHLGVTVQHRSRVAKDPTQPNLRQVHLVHEELFDELRLAGFELAPGAIGENITTQGIDLLCLP